MGDAGDTRRSTAAARLERIGGDRAALAVHVAGLVVAGAVLLLLARNQWFFGDDWDFLTRRRAFLGLADEWLGPHNEHWSTIPLGAFRAIKALWGLDSYVPFMVPVILAHLACCHLAWRVAVRSGAPPWVATGVTAPLLLLGGGAENILWAFQVGFVGSVACGLGAILLLLDDDRRRQVAGAVLALVGLLFSNVTVPLLAAAGLATAHRHGLRRAAILLGPSGVAFLGWRRAFPAPQLFAASDAEEVFVDLPRFVLEGVLGSFERLFVARWLGVVVLVALAVWLLRHLRRLTPALPALAALGGAAVFVLITGYGRVDLGPTAATAPRYTYIVGVLVAPAIAAALAGVRWGRAGGALLLVACVGLAAYQADLLREVAAEDAQRERVLRDALWAMQDRVVADPDAFDRRLRPQDAVNPNITVADLLAFDREGLLHPGETGPAAQLDATVGLEVELESIDDGGPPCPSVPTYEVYLDGPGTLLVTAAESTPVLLFVQEGGLASAPRLATLPEGASRITSTAAGRTILRAADVVTGRFAACER